MSRVCDWVHGVTYWNTTTCEASCFDLTGGCPKGRQQEQKNYVERAAK